jgi:predicted flap endonuclease-1-like 5' DNA nuclease
MTWLQENWIIAVVGLVVAVVLLWWLFGRGKADAITSSAEEPAKPLEPVKPEIIAAEPARFKPIEPAPEPVVTAPPVPAPVAKDPPPPAPVVAPVADPVPPSPAPEPTPPPAPAAPVASEPAAAEPEPAPAPAATPPPPHATTPSAADNLQLLKGVGPKMVGLLGGLGVTRFEQIAAWTEADIARIDPQLGAFQGRVARDNIVDQAGYLARGDKAGFEAKYGALGGEL